MSKRVLLAEIMHESNSFNRIPTRRADFDSRYFWQDATVAEELAGTNTEMCGLLSSARRFGWRVSHPLAASASPSGPMATADWQTIQDLILAPLRVGETFDGVILVLHGAMVTQDSDDPDGDLLAAVRGLVGPTVPVMATLDMHANVSSQMAHSANLLMAYRTYPHVDQHQRGEHIAWLMAQSLERRLLPQCYLARRPMLDAADHGRSGGPMEKLLQAADAVERRPEVFCASLQVGFPWADVACIGPSVVVSGTDEIQCQSHAELLMERLWDSRHDTQLRFAGPSEAMAEAGRRETCVESVSDAGDKSDLGPFIMADFADNPAGGAYGDSPNLLKAMLEARLLNAAFATIADPAAVTAGQQAGEGAEISIDLGGCADPELTPPLPVSGLVKRLSDGNFICEGPMWKSVPFSMGPTMVLQVGGVEVIVSTHPTAVMDLQVFRSQGIEPAEKATIGLKSRNHFRAAFEPLARKVMLVDAGGAASMRLGELPYKKIPRPIWPLDGEG